MVEGASEVRMDPDDVTLMVRVRGGDDSAFNLLVQRHSHRAVNMLFKMVGNRDDAEELAQEAFLRVYRAKESYIPALHGASFSTWFHRIVTNLAINHRRRKRPEPLPDYEQKSTAASAADDAANAESESRIWAALHELPPRQRAALVLTRIEGYSYRDAARIMDVSIEAVRSLIARARGALRVELQPILSTNVPKE